MLLGRIIKANLRVNMGSALGLALFLAPRLFAAAGPSIQIPRIDTPPTLSDFSDMEPSSRVTGHMLKVTGFIVREPADGAQPTQNTDVYLAYDEHNLYAVFVCWDNEPDKIRARMTRREDIFSDDSAEIMIDTFHDARRAYAFAVNPFRNPVGRVVDGRLHRHGYSQRLQRFRPFFRYGVALRGSLDRPRLPVP